MLSVRMGILLFWPPHLCSELMNAYNVCFPVWPPATLAAMAGVRDVMLFCSILARDANAAAGLISDTLRCKIRLDCNASSAQEARTWPWTRAVPAVGGERC